MLSSGTATVDDGVGWAPGDEVSGVQVRPVNVDVDAGPLLRAGLAYMLTLIALATLAPFQFSLETIGSAWLGEVVVSRGDIVRNLLMVAPIGILYRMSRPRRAAWGLDALLLGAAISLTVEACQLFLPMRSPSVLDVVCNATGAWGGAFIVHQLRPWIARQLAAQLATSSPLTHVLWLLTVAIAVSSSIGSYLGRPWTCIPLGLAGSLVLVASWRHGHGECSRMSLRRLSIRAGAWMGLSLAPLAALRPGLLVGSALLVAAATYALGRSGMPRADGRRFELPTLRWVMLAVLAYALLNALFPLVSQRAAAWAARATRGDSPTLLIEQVATLTLVGYLAAASIARRSERDTAPILVAMGSATLIAWALGVVGVPLVGVTSSPALLLPAALLAGLWGGLLYCAQRQAARGDRHPAQRPGLFAIR